MTQNNNDIPIDTPTLPRVRTSDDFLVDWNRNAIASELIRDYNFAKKFYPEIIFDEASAASVAKRTETQIKKLGEDVISSDTIRGIVAAILRKDGQTDLAKSIEIVGMKRTNVNEIWSGSSYADNANLNGKTPETMHKYLADAVAKKAILNEFPEEVRNAHLTGRIHIHDLEYFATRPFCSEWDLRYFFYHGLYADGTGDTIPVASPAKSASVAVLHAAKALGSASSNFAGGQGYQNFLTFVAPYLEGMNYIEIKQLMQMYIYEMSQMMSARGGQAVFSTTQLTPGVPNIFKDVPIVMHGKIWDGVQAPKRTYGEFEREVRLAFKAYTEVMIGGDAFGRPFSFPKYEIELLPEHWESKTWNDPLYAIEKDIGPSGAYLRDIKHKLAPSYKELWMETCKLIVHDGTPYIHNALDTQEGTISCYSCCAYAFQSSAEADPLFQEKLNFANGNHYILGSIQVGTINLPQAAYNSDGDFNKFLEYNKDSMKLLVEVFKIKKGFLDKQLLPFVRQTPVDPNDSSRRAPPLWNDSGLPYVIGIVGLNEAVQTLCGQSIHESQEAYKLAVKILTYLQIEVKELSQESGLIISFARTPAETTAQRFAVCDLLNGHADKALKVIKGDLEYAKTHLNVTKDLPVFYTNGAMVEDAANISLGEKIHLEEHAFSAFDGGNIFHIFMGEESSNPEAILDFIQHLVKTNIKYFTFTKEYSICRSCNVMLKGLQTACNICGSDDVTQFSRITGYIQAIRSKNISGWNKGKIEELKMRNKHEVT